MQAACPQLPFISTPKYNRLGSPPFPVRGALPITTPRLLHLCCSLPPASSRCPTPPTLDQLASPSHRANPSVNKLLHGPAQLHPQSPPSGQHSTIRTSQLCSSHLHPFRLQQTTDTRAPPPGRSYPAGQQRNFKELGLAPCAPGVAQADYKEHATSCTNTPSTTGCRSTKRLHTRWHPYTPCTHTPVAYRTQKNHDYLPPRSRPSYRRRTHRPQVSAHLPLLD
ncbi:hypothetical protein CesoFtcFv8_003035 [Champsocephalus esox]|uniref:Uncharacterized protein n=1 Tax=Champsocephalus esox TaxID=159716 RepID=A0AAN8CZ08_9TELE|nr:hypothetical protein CesoFtcFv8_003035 [Champsocephalus esox]